MSSPKNVPISQSPQSFTDLEKNSFVFTFCAWNDEKQHDAHWEKHLRKIKRQFFLNFLEGFETKASEEIDLIFNNTYKLKELPSFWHQYLPIEHS